MSKKTIVHIGFPKTASTWMQKFLFTREQGFHVIPRNDLISVLDEADIKNKAYYEKNILQKINKTLNACPDHLVPVATWEGFAMNMYDKNVHDYYKRTADRIALHFPNAKILIAIREQNAMVSSLYNQALDSFLIDADFSTYLNCKTPYFQSLASLEYHSLIAHYQNIFHPENVLVWPHEAFCRTPKAVLSKIKDFTGAAMAINELNTSMKVLAKDGRHLAYHHSRHLAPILKGLDFFIRPIQQNKGISAFKMTHVADFIRSCIARFIPEKSEKAHKAWRAAITKKTIGSYFARSNERTSALTGLDLKTYGYETPDSDDFNRQK